jgi:hypothetical protein
VAGRQTFFGSFAFSRVANKVGVVVVAGSGSSSTEPYAFAALRYVNYRFRTPPIALAWPTLTPRCSEDLTVAAVEKRWVSVGNDILR